MKAIVGHNQGERMTWMIFLLGAVFGGAMGWLLRESQDGRDVIIERFIGVDQQHYERLKAYRALEQKLGITAASVANPEVVLPATAQSEVSQQTTLD